MSEDVSRFLSQVKELGERRVEEDEARARELEEKILQDKKERQARRAERARSISPQKASPSHTPSPSLQRIDSHRPEQERLDLETSPALRLPSSAQPQTAGKEDRSDMATATLESISPSKEKEAPLDVGTKPSNPPSPIRSGTVGRGLSWQRRPNSQASDRPRSRPLSAVATENAARSFNTTPDSAPTTEEMTRQQIASALSSKDPSWFRQTADRGANSAAYRRNQVEDTQTVNPSTARAQLPGMSRNISVELPRDEKSDIEPLALPGAVSSTINLAATPKLEPPLEITRSNTSPKQESQEVFSPPLGRTSPARAERPVSPTKGAGGFVQSALMKRSDSMNKRWSVQSPAGLQRADTLASNRSSAGPKIRPKSFLRETSTDSTRLDSNEDGAEDLTASSSNGNARQDTATTTPEPQGQQDTEKTTPPASPSKTMDSRRWSPQKSSWLESALNKPESPKPKAQQPSNQPAWMVELQKAKAQKASHNNPVPESNNPPTASHKHQVSIGGLMRSSAVGGVATTPAGRGSIHSPTPSIDTPVVHVRPSRSQTVPSLTQPSPGSVGEAKQADTAPVVRKAKPETPPKKDFRASLKPRAPPPSSSTGSQDVEKVEFKNVFGNLRKATIQNYVAPDELKDNIARGKAALTVTGGPQKSERKDEFKEAILAKKKEFHAAQQEGRGTVRNNSISSDKSIPEGLLKRAELGRSNTIKQPPATSDAAKADSRRPSTVAKPPLLSESSLRKPESTGTSENSDSIVESLASKPERPGVAAENASTQPRDTNSLPRLQGKISGGLANRFNPALANLLVKGPASTANPTAKLGISSLSESNSTSKVESNDNDAGSGPKLTHMTKNRARGPKRKAPTVASPATTAIRPQTSETEPSALDSLPAQRESESPVPLASLKEVAREKWSEKESLSPAPTPPKPKPITLTGSQYAPDTKTVTEVPTTPSKPEKKNGVHEQAAAFATRLRSTTTGKLSDGPDDNAAKPPSPGKLSTSRFSRFADIAATENKLEQGKVADPPKSMKKFLGNTTTQNVEQKPQPRSPSVNKPKVPLPESPSSRPKQVSPESETQPPVVEPEPKPSDPLASGPLGGRPLPKPPRLVARNSFDPSSESLSQGSQQEGEPLSLRPAPVSSVANVSPIRSPTKQSTDITTSLREFFGPGRPQRNYSADTAGILMQRPNTAPPKNKTLSAQLVQFSSDGKKLPVSSHNERTLFEAEMYLCVHSFINESGDRTVEVYFWAGDEVSESDIQDASIFVSREARASGGTLIQMRQGKETPGFLQALGGIVIVQRGSCTKYDSLAPHMLCGRRYHGHVVFDEVDFTPSALCSGFPYVITQGGRCYLWKGKGSSVDELSCARLIGIDYALSGEMEELEEGREPATFWDLFDGANRFGSADHWRLKPNYGKYCSRLFLSDAASQRQIVELSAYTQKDLLPTSIYVVDAFFELYIVVGSRAQSQYASFHNALDFAQEYAILAAGMEDRPFVPISTVVLEGIPRDLKSVFRKWQDSLSPTMTNTSTAGLKRGRSLKIVSLNQALQALSV